MSGTNDPGSGAGKGPPAEKGKRGSDRDFSDRFGRLGRELAERRAETAREARDESGSGTRGMAGFARAMKLSSEFIAGILVGGGLGWLCDYWLGTSPFGLIVFLLMGFAAGVLNMLRSARLVKDPFAGFPGGADDGSEGGRGDGTDKTGH